ncbi:hypothetical protein [Rufibacter immobilis]|uniref:hypothetical protein n=1 Tax=Rufibacter immobilis TaxID=1348778 RepID=UPI0035EF13C8
MLAEPTDPNAFSACFSENGSKTDGQKKEVLRFPVFGLLFPKQAKNRSCKIKLGSLRRRTNLPQQRLNVISADGLRRRLAQYVSSKQKHKMKRKFTLLSVTLTLMIFSGCNKHYLTYQLVDQQLNINNLKPETKNQVAHYGSYENLKMDYEPNGLAYVICFEKKTNKKVKLSINKDTSLVLTDKTGDKHRLYFDTVVLADSTIHGFKSRFLPIPFSLHASQIDKYEIHAEMSLKSEVKE